MNWFNNIAILLLALIIIASFKKPVPSSEAINGDDEKTISPFNAIVLWIKQRHFMYNLFVGAAVTAFTIGWLWWLGPYVCGKLLGISPSNPDDIWIYNNVWVYIISDVICLIGGPALYYLFVPSLKTDKASMGFILLTIILIIMHITQINAIKAIINPEEAEKFIILGQTKMQDYIDCPRGAEPTFQLKPGEYSPYMRSTYTANISHQSKTGDFKICFRKGGCFIPEEAPRYQPDDFRYLAVTNCHVRAVFK